MDTDAHWLADRQGETIVKRTRGYTLRTWETQLNGNILSWTCPHGLDPTKIAPGDCVGYHCVCDCGEAVLFFTTLDKACDYAREWWGDNKDIYHATLIPGQYLLHGSIDCTEGVEYSTERLIIRRKVYRGDDAAVALSEDSTSNS